MSYPGIIPINASKAVERARAISKLKSKYILGAGGRNPSADTPFTIKNGQLASDCIGFVLWCLGLDRYQPIDGKDVEYPFYEGWINTDSMLMDVHGKQVEFEQVHYPFPGCAVVYPSIWKDGKMIRMGHIALVVEAPKYYDWPTKESWVKMSVKERAKYMAQVKCIDCAGAMKRKITGYAVAERDATLWNKPDAAFVSWKRQPHVLDTRNAFKVEPTPIIASPKLGDRVLQLGMSGADVKELQKILKIAQDGDFGSKTALAVKNYQRSKGLFEDGVVGPVTLASLRKL